MDGADMAAVYDDSPPRALDLSAKTAAAISPMQKNKKKYENMQTAVTGKKFACKK